MKTISQRPALSLTPGFSRVTIDCEIRNRFNGFPPAGKLLKQFPPSPRIQHPVKAGC
jgi:hypothetical protein